MINVHAPAGTRVNAEGHREILVLEVSSAEDGAGRPAFFRDLTTLGLTGVQLVISDAHASIRGDDAVSLEEPRTGPVQVRGRAA